MESFSKALPFALPPLSTLCRSSQHMKKELPSPYRYVLDRFSVVGLNIWLHTLHKNNAKRVDSKKSYCFYSYPCLLVGSCLKTTCSWSILQSVFLKNLFLFSGYKSLILLTKRFFYIYQQASSPLAVYIIIDSHFKVVKRNHANTTSVVRKHG